MGRAPFSSKEGLTKGAWTAMEDRILTEYVEYPKSINYEIVMLLIMVQFHLFNIISEPPIAMLWPLTGLKRSGKSCRLRWLNYLQPDIKRGNISPEEEDLVIRLHKLLGNRWSLIAGRLPGRTDNEIKNYWNSTLSKKIKGNKQTADMSEDETKKKEFPSTEEPRLIQPKAANSKAPRGQKVDSEVAVEPLNVGAIKEDDVLGSKTSESTEGINLENFDFDFDFGEFLLSDMEFWEFDNFTEQGGFEMQ